VAERFRIDLKRSVYPIAVFVLSIQKIRLQLLSELPDGLHGEVVISGGFATNRPISERYLR